MRCPNCGAESADGVYCSNCGAPLPGLSEAEQQLVRKNEEYYARRFARLRGGRVLSWNWAAFLLGPIWLAYRKMTLWALVSLFLFGALFWFGLLWALPLPMVLIGLLGNWAYYWYVRFWGRECATRPPEQLERAFLRRGGVSLPYAAVTAVLILVLWLCWWRFFSTAVTLFSFRG